MFNVLDLWFILHTQTFTCLAKYSMGKQTTSKTH